MFKNIVSINKENNIKIIKILGIDMISIKKDDYTKIIKLFDTNIISIEKVDYTKIVNILGFNIKVNNKKKLLYDVKKINLALSGINKDKINYQLKLFKSIGINKTPKNGLIVSLTSFADRIHDVHYCIYSLLNQTIKPDMVILWLAEEEFPNKENDLPDELLKLRNNGLSIKWCSNLRSYKKIIPTLKEYPNNLIVTADDDIYYPQNWLEKLYNSYLKDKTKIHCHRAHYITLDKKKINPYSKWKHLIEKNSYDFNVYPQTGGGILYPPNSFHSDVTEESIFQTCSPNCDETWLWAMSILKCVKTKIVENPIKNIRLISPLREYGFYLDEINLYNTFNGNGGKDRQIKAVIEKYPQIKEILKK